MKNIKVDIVEFPEGEIVLGLSFIHDESQTVLTFDLFKWGVSIGHYR